MGKARDKGEKEFFIAIRKKVGSGVTNAPVWAMQKKGARIWNKKQKKHWRQTDFGNDYRNKLKEEGNLRNKKGV